MKKKPLFLLLIGLIGGMVLLAGMLQMLPLLSSANALTEAEVKDIVAKRYKGKISTIQMEKDNYVMQVEQELGTYEIVIDKNSGGVVSLTRVKATENQIAQDKAAENIINEAEVREIIQQNGSGEIQSIRQVTENEKNMYRVNVKENENITTLLVDAHSGNIISSTPEQTVQPAVRIGEQEAEEIALAEINGTVDNIELETINENLYYLVEINTVDDEEVEVAIHAITGEIESLSWEEEEEEGSDDENE
ncbi:PepSY domain-containing protein [Bacillaceae bacterium Marseille-Q3522]|nr:PepSY domain-containing protein [Bacillaceae bacterium Marseille-Q3522]